MSLRVAYSTHEFGEVDIHLRTLRNVQEYHDADGTAEKLGISSATWPIFGVVWPSGQVLAHHLFTKDCAGKRILEVGCGIGLTTVLLNHLKLDVTATDYHLEVGNFLLENTRLNRDTMVPFVRTGWDDPRSELGEYDMIIGSDLLYEDEHIDMLANFMVQHARPQCEIILVDPGRGRHAKFSRKLEALGFTLEMTRLQDPAYLDKPYKGVILSYRREAIEPPALTA